MNGEWTLSLSWMVWWLHAHTKFTMATRRITSNFECFRNIWYMENCLLIVVDTRHCKKSIGLHGQWDRLLIRLVRIIMLLNTSSIIILLTAREQFNFTCMKQRSPSGFHENIEIFSAGVSIRQCVIRFGDSYLVMALPGLFHAVCHRLPFNASRLQKAYPMPEGKINILANVTFDRH